MSASAEFENVMYNSSISNSFWENKHYGRCVRRLENGNNLCSDMCNMIQDRVVIERQYAASLHKWEAKWAGYLENSIGSTVS